MFQGNGGQPPGLGGGNNAYRFAAISSTKANEIKKSYGAGKTEEEKENDLREEHTQQLANGDEALMAQLQAGYGMQIQQDLHFQQLMTDYENSDDARNAALANDILEEEFSQRFAKNKALILPLSEKIMTTTVAVDHG